MGWTLVEGGLMGIASLYLKARKGLSQIVCVTEVVELAGASPVVAERAGILLLWMRHASKPRWWSMHHTATPHTKEPEPWTQGKGQMPPLGAWAAEGVAAKWAKTEDR